jgi:CHASE2 domain-containing sensor protein
MERILKIAAVAIALTALAVLSFFGLAIWVFIPLMPAAIVYLIAVTSLRRTSALRPRPSQAEVEQRKAA